MNNQYSEEEIRQKIAYIMDVSTFQNMKAIYDEFTVGVKNCEWILDQIAEKQHRRSQHKSKIKYWLTQIFKGKLMVLTSLENIVSPVTFDSYGYYESRHLTHRNKKINDLVHDLNYMRAMVDYIEYTRNTSRQIVEKANADSKITANIWKIINIFYYSKEPENSTKLFRKLAEAAGLEWVKETKMTVFNVNGFFDEKIADVMQNKI